jgi:hypothetical protein
MKTREQIYGREAAAILRDISMYRVLTEEQILRLHPCKRAREQDKIKILLAYLVKQQRVWLSEDGRYYCATPDALEDMDQGLFAAVWVLADFIDQAEFHSVGDYPAKIIFFADGEVYEIVHAAQGREVLVSHVLSSPGEQPSRYLVLVDDPDQIEELQIPLASGYCSVAPTGEVQYYQKE